MLFLAFRKKLLSKRFLGRGCLKIEKRFCPMASEQGHAFANLASPLHKISLRWKVKGVTERNQTCFASLTPYSLPKSLLKYKYFRDVSGRE